MGFTRSAAPSAASNFSAVCYFPYEEVTVYQNTRYGDRDGDLDVDSTDATKFDSLTQGQARHPGKTSTGVDQPFAHQGLLLDY